VSGVRETGLAGRCVIVTGAARGQGAAHARALAAEGTRVVLADVLDDLGEQVAIG
jgi:3alpha(or 20beta)-hydroxysteroid dehydrogenase